MSIFKNRTLLGVACVLVAAILAFIVSPALSRSKLDEVTIYAAGSDITIGTQITESNVVATAVPAAYVPIGAMTSADQIVGKYAATDISAKDYFFEEKLSVEPPVKNNWESMIDKEHLAMSVTIKSFAAGLSGKLEPEDVVSFIAPTAKDADTKTEIPALLQYVRVLAVTTSSGVDYDAQTVTAENTVQPVTITVMVSPTQAVALAELELNGNLYAALVCRDDTEKAAALLNAQAAVTMAAAAPVMAGGNV